MKGVGLQVFRSFLLTTEAGFHSVNPLEDSICALSASEVMHPTKRMLEKVKGTNDGLKTLEFLLLSYQPIKHRKPVARGKFLGFCISASIWS